MIIASIIDSPLTEAQMGQQTLKPTIWSIRYWGHHKTTCPTQLIPSLFRLNKTQVNRWLISNSMTAKEKFTHNSLLIQLKNPTSGSNIQPTTLHPSHCSICRRFTIDYHEKNLQGTCIRGRSPEPSGFPLWLKKSQNVTCIVSKITFVMLSLLTRCKWGPFHFLICKPKSDAAIFHQQKLDKVYDQNI